MDRTIDIGHHLLAMSLLRDSYSTEKRDLTIGCMNRRRALKRRFGVDLKRKSCSIRSNLGVHYEYLEARGNVFASRRCPRAYAEIVLSPSPRSYPDSLKVSPRSGLAMRPVGS